MELHGGDAEPLEPLVEAEALVVDPPELVLPQLLASVESAAPASPVRVLLSPAVADAISEEFLLESRVAGSMARDELRVREMSSRCDDRVVLTDDAAGVLVGVDQRLGVLSLDDEPMLGSLRETYEPVWSDAETFSPRAPSGSRLYGQAAAPLPDGFTTQLERAVDGASTLEWHGSPTPIELALVVAARTRAHHYDLCTWAEETEFTSRSTAARTKQRLEEAGLLEVEPVPQERGRPRQRLQLGDESLAAVDPAELVPTLRRRTA